MVKLLFQLLTYLVDHAPLLTNLAVLTGIFLLLARSIKKHAGVYYLLFALPALYFLLREVGSLFDWTFLTYSRGSLWGKIMREYVHVAGFAYPLLIIIMFVGALPARNPSVKRLLSIRKELSIISGFPILVHVWVRIRNIGGSFEFFAGPDAYMATHTRAGSLLGSSLTHSAYLLGVLMAILFLVLWITSFDAVHKRLGAVKWKKVQRWSYVLYAMLFLHSVLLSTARFLGPAGGGHGRGGGGENMMLISIIGITTTCLIFASYLILRLRKHRLDRQRP
jgi:DMSO/TMAO reductase YedYZ heme-binding membrane subunit